MKMLICTSGIILFLLLGGCGEKEYEKQDTQLTVSEETAIPFQTTDVKDTLTQESGEESPTESSVENNRLQYAEIYGTEYQFTDVYISGKCWLIGDENIVQIVSIGGYDDITVMQLSEIARVESMPFDGFSSVTVFDKTNQSISIMTSPTDAETVLGLLE